MVKFFEVHLPINWLKKCYEDNTDFLGIVSHTIIQIILYEIKEN